MIGVQARIICSACPEGNLPQNQKPSYRRYRRFKKPDDDVIIIHNVGERRAIYCAPPVTAWTTGVSSLSNAAAGRDCYMLFAYSRFALT